MPHEITMRPDGLLIFNLIGNFDLAEMNSFIKDLTPYIEAATPASPLRILAKANQAGIYSTAARKAFMQLNTDSRLGKTAVLQATRPTRVLYTFIQKATGNNNTRFFDLEDQAATWLKGN